MSFTSENIMDIKYFHIQNEGKQRGRITMPLEKAGGSLLLCIDSDDVYKKMDWKKYEILDSP